ncbi:response regulator transcription factor [Alloscardovia criceti]|uniref:response regulator transcription factor n=1 Tax=Alloscardovia criceti TaxID=356828 RepID=UPI000360622B|nr:response regulator transcription factor [Alloscardovia criceti]
MIYYLEDDEQIREMTLYTLNKTGFEAVGCSTASQLDELLSKEIPDLLLLDEMLPDADGLQVLAKLRNNPKTASLPVIIITARSTEFDAVTGLDAGADDFIPKPFGMMELVSRIHALLRRSQRNNTNEDLLTAGGISLDSQARQVSVNGQVLDLTRKEFDVLELLLNHRGIVLTREQLFEQVWGFVDAQSRTVDTHIQTLRHKIDAIDPQADLIETVRGVGYRFAREGK